jgi:hypothetical protein
MQHLGVIKREDPIEKRVFCDRAVFVRYSDRVLVTVELADTFKNKASELEIGSERNRVAKPEFGG